MNEDKIIFESIDFIFDLLMNLKYFVVGDIVNELTWVFSGELKSN